MSVFDVIVVGAGVEGSATAYQLVKNGAKRVLLLEQVKAQSHSVDLFAIINMISDLSALVTLA